MMEIINHLDLSVLSTAGLVLFLAVFVAVLLYALTRTPSQAEQWSRIPLTSDASENTPSQTSIES